MGCRQAAFILLCQERKDEESFDLQHGGLTKVAQIFRVTRPTMASFWRAMCVKLGEAGLRAEEVYNEPEFFKSGACNRGRNRIYNASELRRAVSRVPFENRGTYRDLSAFLSIPLSSLHRLQTRDGAIRRHSSSLKPLLSPENKVARVEYVLDEVFPVSVDGKYFFKDMFDRVDVDEKWFYMTRDHQNYIVAVPEEEWEDDVDEEEYDNQQEDEELPRLPHRTTRHKNFIGKVLFLCAQARPRFDPGRNAWWDGKIGMWAVGTWEPAARDSVRRPAGTLEWKGTSINRDSYRNLLLQNVVPAIMASWPRQQWNNNRFIVRIQQDGPSSHISPDDEGFLEGLRRLGVENKVLLYTQPPNSPDLNINDLGFFRALSARHEKLIINEVDELIDAVRNIYLEFPYHKINFIYLTLQSVMNEIIKCNGDNDYVIPHMAKEALARRGELPKCIEVVDDALEYLGLL